ncbi:protein-tyrosine phosphatase [Gammaproteobacteria bacterium]
MFKNILTVCVGNICRSPMAEYLIRQNPMAQKVGVVISSAGLSALTGFPADPMAQELLRERGIDLSAHRARKFTPDLLVRSDLILVMEAWQQREIERMSPVARGKVHMLGRWRNTEIPDPYSKPRAAFEEALTLIESSIHDWKNRLW